MSIRKRVTVVLLSVCALGSGAYADDWPQWRGPSRDGVWRETGVVEKFAGKQTEPVWKAEIGAGYSGPTVAEGRVYVTDRVVQPKQIERIHCFDAATGKKLWSHEYDCVYRGVGYDAGPRASVLVKNGKAYSLGAMGDLICLDAATGKVIWKRDLDDEYKVAMPTWGIAASPLAEGGALITQVGGEDGACVVAFDLETGKERWRALEDRASYSAPVVLKRAGKRVLIVWTGDNVCGLDPANGKVLWKEPFTPAQMVMQVATPVIDGDALFVTGFFDGSLMLRLKPDLSGVERGWMRRGENERKTDALHSTISTPLLMDGHIYGVDSYGELRCLDATTGERVWESQAAVPRERWANVHLVQNGEKIWMFNDRGELLITKLSPKGFEEISRTKIIDPTTEQLRRGDGVTWSHPAFANRKVYARNDRELVCIDVAAK